MGTPTTTISPRWGGGHRDGTRTRGATTPSYSCPSVGWQTAAHTSATNSWGKANSPSTESKPRASWATLGLPFATSTIVEAREEERQGQRWERVRDGHPLPTLPTHPARCRGCPCSSPVDHPLGWRLLPRRGWAGGKRPSGWVPGGGGMAQGPPHTPTELCPGVPHTWAPSNAPSGGAVLGSPGAWGCSSPPQSHCEHPWAQGGGALGGSYPFLQRGRALRPQPECFLPADDSGFARGLAAPRPLPDHICTPGWWRQRGG